MRYIVITLKLLIYIPSLWLSRLHILKADFEMRLDLVRVWSSTLLKMIKTKVQLIHKNHIPLEDGYVFLVNHTSAYDVMMLTDVFPVNFGLILDKNDSIRWINPLISALKPMKIDYESFAFDDADELCLAYLKAHQNIILFNQSLSGKTLNLSFYTWLKAHRLTVIPVRVHGAERILKSKQSVVRIDIALPLYFDEYQMMSPEQFKAELSSTLQATPDAKQTA